MNASLKIFGLTLLFFVCIYPVDAQQNKDTVGVDLPEKTSPISVHGQLTGWTVMQLADPVNTQLGARFVPVLTGNFNPGMDFEASLNAQSAFDFTGARYDTATYVFKPYRLWLRHSGDNWEIRGGLQQINFGTAKMFRPLMWFDRMDVRDPLRLTDGVYALLGKYFFPINANIWLWSLIGNDKPKGFEFLGSARWIPEVGGRLQVPLGPGELAFSTHYRKADVRTLLPVVPERTYLDETRFGLDGKWDIGIGLWFEASTALMQKNEYNIALYQDFLNVGGDYTLPVGNGIGVSAEYFRYHIGDTFFNGGKSIGIIGSMFTYPVSILDNASAMFFYVSEQNLWFNYLSFHRTYDEWDFYLIGFWNPETMLPVSPLQSGQRNLFAGKGLQFLVNYNF